jgi:hypothetical protein
VYNLSVVGGVVKHVHTLDNDTGQGRKRLRLLKDFIIGSNLVADTEVAKKVDSPLVHDDSLTQGTDSVGGGLRSGLVHPRGCGTKGTNRTFVPHPPNASCPPGLIHRTGT